MENPLVLNDPKIHDGKLTNQTAMHCFLEAPQSNNPGDCDSLSCSAWVAPPQEVFGHPYPVCLPSPYGLASHSSIYSFNKYMPGTNQGADKQTRQTPTKFPTVMEPTF